MQIPSAHGVMQVKEGTSGRREVTTKLRCPVPINYLTYLHEILQSSDREAATDTEWGIIRTVLPTKPRSVARVDDQRVLKASFWV